LEKKLEEALANKGVNVWMIVAVIAIIVVVVLLIMR
jgi:hypothetical protein